MAKYGQTALRVADLLQNKDVPAKPVWQGVADEMFATRHGRNKSCPRGAFLGLCHAGVIRGVSPNTSPDPPSVNGKYAIKAVHLLAANPDLARGSQLALWKRVMTELGAHSSKKHNAQMDVVLALWNAALIDA